MKVAQGYNPERYSGDLGADSRMGSQSPADQDTPRKREGLRQGVARLRKQAKVKSPRGRPTLDQLRLVMDR